MTLLFISSQGEGLGLAMRCAEEGYTTSLFTEDDDSGFVGVGLVNISSFSKHLLSPSRNCIASNINQLLSLERPDIVIMTSPGMGRVTDYLRDDGVKVFGGGHWADTLSNGGGYTKEIMKRIGVGVWKGEVGVEICCGAWWNGFRLTSPYISLNETHFLTGSLGPRIPSAGNVSHHISTDFKIFTEGIGRMERLLKKTKFKGNISLSSVVTKNGLFGISFITSPLFFPSLLESYKGSVTELLSGVVSGQESRGKFTTDYTLSIPVSIPPYPHALNGSSVDIGGVCVSNLRHPINLLHLLSHLRHLYQPQRIWEELFILVQRLQRHLHLNLIND